SRDRRALPQRLAPEPRSQGRRAASARVRGARPDDRHSRTIRGGPAPGVPGRPRGRGPRRLRRGPPAPGTPRGSRMLTVGPNTRVFVALEPVDMRGSFDALAGHVRRLHADPLDGHIYLFLNRTRRLLKALWFDRTG